jgi:SAM-dependent methyltransferase
MEKHFLFNILDNYIPNDHSKQVEIRYYIEDVLDLSGQKEQFTVLDLGCGNCESLNYFTSLNSKIEWYGIDIDDSPTISNKTKINDRFFTFDGINIPFPNDHFDMVYCKQVFEHVKNPRELLHEVNRVLKVNGIFVGSTSHLEPYHALSYWNYTPYGFSVLLKEVNLQLIEIRPSIDALTLIIRRGLNCPKFFNVFWRIESPLNFLITMVGKIFRMSKLTINTIKLLFSGQFIFYSKKNQL